MTLRPPGQRRKITAAEVARRKDKALKRENSTPPNPYTPDLVRRKRGKSSGASAA